jgi:molybdenum cofactor biosynthesis protein B
VVITVSDTRTAQDDSGGSLLCDRLKEASATIVKQLRVTDDESAIETAILQSCEDPIVDLVALTGGTGIAPRDVTVEVVERLLHKRLDGFGEAFRRLSWDQVGARSVLSRALAGSRGQVLIVALPGSPNAVKLAVDMVLAPMMGHAVKLLKGSGAAR